MTRRQKDPLRPLTAEERHVLSQISRAQSEPANHVERAKLLLAVADALSYMAAAHAIGRRSNDAVSALVGRFNREGLAALVPRHGGGPALQYGPAEHQRILTEFHRQPDRARWDSHLVAYHLAACTAHRSRPSADDQHLRDLVRAARGRLHLARKPHLVPNGHGAAQARRRDSTRQRPRCRTQKKLIEQAYTLAHTLGLAVWCEDEAGPYQTIPYPGPAWDPQGQPTRHDHEYSREGTAKLLTLFCPASGQVRVKGVRSCTNAVLHPWLKTELTAILAQLVATDVPLDAPANPAAWERWQDGLSTKATLSTTLPPLRLLLVLDNLAGHTTPEFVVWCWLMCS